MKYSKNQKAAKDFLRWAHTKENYDKWFVVQKGFAIAPTRDWEKHPMWKQDPVMLPFSKASLTRPRRWATPASRTRRRPRRGTSTSSPTCTRRSANGKMTAEDSVKWAAGELRKIYV